MKTEGSGQNRLRPKLIRSAKAGNGKAERTPDRTPELPSAQRESGGEAAAEPVYAPSREEKIAIVAYYKAQRRGFASSGELDDWLEAEREVDRNGGEGEADNTRHT